jgi:hypothetical protein
MQEAVKCTQTAAAEAAAAPAAAAPRTSAQVMSRYSFLLSCSIGGFVCCVFHFRDAGCCRNCRKARCQQAICSIEIIWHQVNVRCPAVLRN